jgi:hypothetical protein
VPANSPARSMTSSAATARQSFVSRRMRRSRTPTRNVGSAPYAANSATTPSSGTTDNSNISSTNTSSTTTCTYPTAASANALRPTRKSSRIGLVDRSDDTPPAADSSTSTAKQPELPRDNGQPRMTHELQRAHSPTTRPDIDVRRCPPRVGTRFRHSQAVTTTVPLGTRQ